jgi:hypothetical protein
VNPFILDFTTKINTKLISFLLGVLSETYVDVLFLVLLSGLQIVQLLVFFFLALVLRHFSLGRRSLLSTPFSSTCSLSPYLCVQPHKQRAI